MQKCRISSCRKAGVPIGKFGIMCLNMRKRVQFGPFDFRRFTTSGFKTAKVNLQQTSNTTTVCRKIRCVSEDTLFFSFSSLWLGMIAKVLVDASRSTTMNFPANLSIRRPNSNPSSNALRYDRSLRLFPEALAKSASGREHLRSPLRTLSAKNDEAAIQVGLTFLMIFSLLLMR